MFFRQYFLGCLAHASYLIGSDGVACVVDPQRDVKEYIEDAEREGLTIKYIFESHLHADFVSGHRELAEATGAKIVYSEKARAQFEHLAVADGEVLTLGQLQIKILATPGHTPESICLLVSEKGSSEPARVLTGDTLFIGDVGRPDLVGKYGFSSLQMAEMLYDSLHQKLLTLPDETLVYPAHGAGSLCGKNISTERFSTIGTQRKYNWALAPMNREKFVDLLVRDLPEVPAYFGLAVETNRAGARALSELVKPTQITAAELSASSTILDVRSASAFCSGHWPGSINIGLDGQFASWCGTILGAGESIIIVCDQAKQADEAVLRLARAGLEGITGYIFAADLPSENLLHIKEVTVTELSELLAGKNPPQVIDVRRSAEYRGGHVPGAKNFPLSEIEKNIATIDSATATAVICQGGYRSGIAVSLLKKNGLPGQIINVKGGTQAWRKEELPVQADKLTACSG